MVKSCFPNRPPTFYFFYPREVVVIYHKKGQGLGEVLYGEEETEDGEIGIQLRHKDVGLIVTPEFKKFMKNYSMPMGKIGKVYAGLRNILKENGFTLSKGPNFNLAWGYCSSKDSVKTFDKNQRFSHFPGCWQIGRKDNLWMNLSKRQRSMPDIYNFLPKTFCLKIDYETWVKNKDTSQYWILKPVDAARGEGIRLISQNERPNPKNLKNYLASQYISKVHLINGYKYDLRVYVIVTCMDPLRVYVYKEGLVRFATEKYTLGKKKIKNTFAH